MVVGKAHVASREFVIAPQKVTQAVRLLRNPEREPLLTVSCDRHSSCCHKARHTLLSLNKPSPSSLDLLNTHFQRS